MALFHQEIKKVVEPYLMLKHPFYQKWMEGRLSLSKLQFYTTQYEPFVNYFPCLVSRVHSQCSDNEARKELLQNLIEEEGFPNLDDHPTLWKKFAHGIGAKEPSLENPNYCDAALTLKKIFKELADQSYAEGLSALYCYEHQIPEVSKTKIDGLSKFYGINDEQTLLFFKVHQDADVFHSESCERLLNNLPIVDHDKALVAAEKSAKAIWSFLCACE